MALPDRTSQPNDAMPDSERGDRAPRSSMRRRLKVMVIDDSEIVLGATRAMLEAGGFEVVVCDSPIGAVLRVVGELPDLVLVDLNMASISGDRVVASIKNGARTSTIPVCFFTSAPFSEVREIMRRCRADGYIAKGSDELQLAAAVRRATAR